DHWEFHQQDRGEQGCWSEHCNAVNGWNLEPTFNSMSSRLENMLTRIMQNQEEDEATIRHMAEVVSAQSESLQNLDFRMSQVLNHDDTPIIYFDEASKSCEEDPSAFCLVVITRSGKVVHSKPHMTVEEEIYDAEKLHIKVNVAPKEMNYESSSEKMNEKSRKDAPFPLCKHPLPNPSFSQRLRKKHNVKRIVKYLELLKQMPLNIPFIDAIKEMSWFS
ncbi:hypothetical protein HAX54_047547, partial [Datura stramonium]|nr:hypothetical protein [Datura stramonium]